MRVRHDIDGFTSLLVAKRWQSRDEFIAKAGAKAGYAKQFFSKVFDCIYVESEDLLDSYERYYACEFKTFRDYLIHEFSLLEEDADEICSSVNEHAGLTLLLWDRYSYGEQSLPELIFSDDHYDKFIKLITGE